MAARPANTLFVPTVSMSKAAPDHGFEQVSTLRVRYAETDRMGVVYHANYLVWCEIGRTDFIRSTLASYADLEAQGVMLAVTDANIRFLRGARYDDPIEVRTRLLDVRSRSLRFGYEIVHAERGERLAEAETGLIRLDESGRTSALPLEIREVLLPLVAQTGEGS